VENTQTYTLDKQIRCGFFDCIGLLHTSDKHSGVAFLTAPGCYTLQTNNEVAFLTAPGCYTACLTLKSPGGKTPFLFFLFFSFLFFSLRQTPKEQGRSTSSPLLKPNGQGMDHPCCAVDWEILQMDTLVQWAGSTHVCPVIHPSIYSFIHSF
jgi:hypothetical protein